MSNLNACETLFHIFISNVIWFYCENNSWVKFGMCSRTVKIFNTLLNLEKWPFREKHGACQKYTDELNSYDANVLVDFWEQPYR